MEKVIIAGASGMVGMLIQEQCLASNKISEVVSLVRKKTDNHHPKLNEKTIKDFKNLSGCKEFFLGVQTAYFCIGAYSGSVPDEMFKVITVDYAVEFAKLLKENSPNARLCFLSGAGADRKEKSRVPFAKYKGMAENQISDMKLAGFHVFRPGYIYPVSPRKEPNFMYKVSRALYPVIKLFGSNASIKSTDLAKAMFSVGLNGHDMEILENRDILNCLK